MYYMAIDLDSWEELYRTNELENKECLLPDKLAAEHKKAKELLGCVGTPWMAYNSEELAIENSYSEQYDTYILMKLDLGDVKCVALDSERVTFEKLSIFNVLGSQRKEK